MVVVILPDTGERYLTTWLFFKRVYIYLYESKRKRKTIPPVAIHVEPSSSSFAHQPSGLLLESGETLGIGNPCL